MSDDTKQKSDSKAKSAPVPAQPWDSTTMYPADSVVSYTGGTYTALVPNQSVMPGTDDNTWKSDQPEKADKSGKAD